MYLLEFQAQGAKGFSTTTKVPLKPGYLVLKPPSNAACPLAALASALFYSDGRGGDASFLAEGVKAGKAGFTVLGNDQTTYRLVRELGRSGVLHRLDKTSSTFELVSDSASEIGTYLRATVGFPSKTAFEQLFVCSGAQLPSRRPKASAKPAGTSPSKSGPQPSLQQASAVDAATDIPAAEAKVKELENELKLAKEVEEIQFKVDGVAREMDDLEAKMKGSEGLRAAIAQAIADQKGAPDGTALGLTPDIVERAEGYSAFLQKRDEALAKLGEAPTDEASPSTPSYVEPLIKNQHFWIGTVLGTAFLVGGLFLEGFARAVALLDVPAFAFAALTALRHVEDLQGASKVSNKGSMRAGREKKILDSFNTETAPVKDAMQILGVDSPDQVATMLSQAPLLQQKVAELQQQLNEWEAQPENRRAAQEYQKLKAKHEAMNQKLTESGGYLRDAREVERELGRTKESIAKAKSGAAPDAPAGAASAAGELEDPGPALFKVATDLFQLDGPSLASLLKDRASQYLSALSDKRYAGLECDLRGAMTAVSQTGKTKAVSLPPKDLDLAYLSVRLTIVEKYAAKTKLPLFLEDGLGLEEAKLQLLSRMLKHLGTLTQVVHVTGHAAFGPMADQSGNL